MKLDELRKHLRAELESEAKPKREPTVTEKTIADYVKRNLEAAEAALSTAGKRCFDCGKPCLYEDENGPISIVLCPVCMVKHKLITKHIPTRKCERCGEDFEIELEVVDEETMCPVCELGPL